MHNPRFERLPNVCLADRNHEVQTLPTRGPNESFAIGVRLRRFVWSLQDRQPQCFQRYVHALRINAVTIMYDESVSFIACYTFPKLLQCPMRRWVPRDIRNEGAFAYRLP